MRQNGNCTYFSLLNRVGRGVPSKQDMECLKSRLCIESEELEKNLHIFPLRRQVENHNNRLLAKMVENVLSIPALHYFSQADQNALNSVEAHLIPKDDRDAGGLCNILQIAVNARVMLIRNIQTGRGLVNSAMGTVTNIDYEMSNNEQSVPSKIYVLFDDCRVGRLNCVHNMSMHNPIPIEPVQHKFTYSGRQIVRTQFPLVLAWGCTVHKVQGMSLDCAVLDVGLNVFEKGMAYVALSRIVVYQDCT